MRRVVRLAAGAGALIVGVLSVGAMPAGAEPTIAARMGVRGGYRVGQPVPVLVTVKADRLVRGVVRVSRPGTDEMPVEVPFEVSAGSAKDVIAVLPTDPGNGANGLNASKGPGSNGPGGTTAAAETSAQVELVEDGNEVAQAQVRADSEEWVELVGVLPQVAAQVRAPDTAPLAHNSGTARLATVDAALLDAGPGALGPFSSLVVAPGELASLTPAARQAVLLWVATGGQLYVDGPPGAVDGLPEAWQPRTGWARADAGIVRVSRGEAQAGRWAFLEPTLAGANPTVSSSNMPSGDVTASLGHDAGVQIPELGLVLGVLAGYVVLCGPVNFVVLARRRQRTLAWLTVPALSALFAAGFTVAGARTRGDVEGAHATIVEVVAGGSWAHSYSLIGSSNGGPAVLHLPAGWLPESSGNYGYSYGRSLISQSSATPLTTSAGGVDARLQLAPAEYALVHAGGPLREYETALQVGASTDGTSVTGTVHNNLGVALHETVVLVNNVTVKVGDVPAHGEAAFNAHDVLLDQNPGVQGAPELAFWPADDIPGGYGYGYGYPIGTSCVGRCPQALGAPTSPRPVADNVVSPEAWRSFAQGRQRVLRPMGSVSAVGWTRELPSPLAVDGAAPMVKGRTGFVARAAINPASNPASLDSIGVGFAPVREAVYADSPPAARAGSTDVPAVDSVVVGPLFRIDLPTTVGGQPLDPTRVELRPPAFVHRFAIATATGWKVTPEQADPIQYRLSADDVIDGAVYVRMRMTDELSPHDQVSGVYSGWRFTLAQPGTPAGAALDVRAFGPGQSALPPPAPAAGNADGPVKGKQP